jgi:hypothetical protein
MEDSRQGDAILEWDHSAEKRSEITSRRTRKIRVCFTLMFTPDFIADTIFWLVLGKYDYAICCE